eukprot:scaffold250449_cov14-Tisochrysis_lutea.AAC.1
MQGPAFLLGALLLGNKCKAEGVMSKAPLFLSVCGAVEQDCILATSCTQQVCSDLFRLHLGEAFKADTRPRERLKDILDRNTPRATS